MAIGVGAIAAVAPRSGWSAEITKEEVFHDKDAPVLGNPKGDITIVEYFDYQCPFCKKGHPDVMKLVEKDGGIRLIMKDWPILGDASVFAAQAVLGASALGKYEKAMEALMKLPGQIDQNQVQAALSRSGIPMKDLAAAVNRNSSMINGLLDRNYAQALAFNFVGTPSFIIGKTLYPGALDAKALTDAVTHARRKS
jgi:protein-disulfide isomerase